MYQIVIKQGDLQDRQRHLRAVLREFVGTKVEITRSVNGKPFCRGGPYFSLSHSGSWLAIVVSSVQVGIDIEVMRPIRHQKKMSQRLFGTEFSAIEDFFDAFTRKEAMTKAFGFKLRSYPVSYPPCQVLSLAMYLPPALRGFWCAVGTAGHKPLLSSFHSH